MELYLSITQNSLIFNIRLLYFKFFPIFYKKGSSCPEWVEEGPSESLNPELKVDITY